MFCPRNTTWIYRWIRNKSLISLAIFRDDSFHWNVAPISLRPRHMDGVMAFRYAKRGWIGIPVIQGRITAVSRSVLSNLSWTSRRIFTSISILIWTKILWRKTAGKYFEICLLRMRRSIIPFKSWPTLEIILNISPVWFYLAFRNRLCYIIRTKHDVSTV